MAKVVLPENKPRYKQLNVRIPVEVLKRARATACMADMRFARFVEKALLAAMTTNPTPDKP